MQCTRRLKVKTTADDLSWLSIGCNYCIMKSAATRAIWGAAVRGSYGVMQGNPRQYHHALVQFGSSWPADELICSSPVAAWPGLASAKSGRRSDSFQSEEEEGVVLRRELTYSQPPRSRGGQDSGQNITLKSC